MSSTDRFLRQVKAVTNKAWVREAITTPADEKRFDIAESHFALMIRADNNREGATQALDDARWNYFWTLKHFVTADMSLPHNIVNLVDDFAERVRQIGQNPQNRLDLPTGQQAQVTPAPVQ